MKAFSFIRVGVALATVAGIGVGVVQAGPAFAGANYQYSITGRVHEDFTTSGVGKDTGLCDPVEHIVLDANEAVHITATQPGLSDDEVRTLLEEDPDGIALRSSYRLTGEFVAETASGHVSTVEIDEQQQARPGCALVAIGQRMIPSKAAREHRRLVVQVRIEVLVAVAGLRRMHR